MFFDWVVLFANKESACYDFCWYVELPLIMYVVPSQELSFSGATFSHKIHFSSVFDKTDHCLLLSFLEDMLRSNLYPKNEGMMELVDSFLLDKEGNDYSNTEIGIPQPYISCSDERLSPSAGYRDEKSADPGSLVTLVVTRWVSTSSITPDMLMTLCLVFLWFLIRKQ